MLNEAMCELADGIASTTGLRTFDHVPEQINPPAVIVSLGAGTYNTDMDGAVEFNAAILVLVTQGAGLNRAQTAFQAYIDPAIDTSVPAAVKAIPSLSDVVDAAGVVEWSDPQTYEIGGVAYIGVEITAELLASS